MHCIAFVGIILEKFTVRCLLDYLTLNWLHEEYQSAYYIVQKQLYCLFGMTLLVRLTRIVQCCLSCWTYQVRTYLDFCAQCVQIDYNIPDYSATKWCATGLGPSASYVHTIHHSNAADI